MGIETTTALPGLRRSAVAPEPLMSVLWYGASCGPEQAPSQKPAIKSIPWKKYRISAYLLLPPRSDTARATGPLLNVMHHVAISPSQRLVHRKGWPIIEVGPRRPTN